MQHADTPVSSSSQSSADDHPFAAFDVVVVATSLGGREALEHLLEPLAVDFPAPIVVVQHLDAQSPSYLPEMLARRTRLAVKVAEAGDALCPSTVYVAAPARHLLIGPDRRCLLSDEPPVRFSRPSADPLFASAAELFGARTLAVILTGRLSDGTVGAAAIRRAGGVVLAQDPATCRAPEMPEAAIRQGLVHVVLPPEALGAALNALVAVRGARALFGLDSRAA